MEFRHCTFKLQQFNFLGKFENVIFPLTSLVTFAKKCQNFLYFH